MCSVIIQKYDYHSYFQFADDKKDLQKIIDSKKRVTIPNPKHYATATEDSSTDEPIHKQKKRRSNEVRIRYPSALHSSSLK